MKMALFGLATLGTLAGFLVFSHASEPVANPVDEVEQIDPAEGNADRGADVDSREIPLESILTTGPQKTMRNAFHEFPTTATDKEILAKRRSVDSIYHDTKCGSSNLFLVEGTDEHDALRATFNSLVAAWPTNKPIRLNFPNPPRGSYWLVAYLGTSHTSPPQWTVASVSVQNNKIRLSFRKAKPGVASLDLQPYYFWVPLGQIDRGAYELELFDEDAKAISMMRRVEVK